MARERTKQVTYISVVMDRSGSMAPLERETINSFNEWLGEIKEASKGKDVSFTLHLFDHKHELIYQDERIGNVRRLTHEEYYSRGMTALYDAIAMEISWLERVCKSKDRALLLIMTDGFENASQKTTRDEIRRLLGKAEERPNWTVQYIGANQDAIETAGQMGLRNARQAAFTRSHDDIGTRAAFRAVTLNSTEYLHGNAARAQSLSQADYEHALQDIREGGVASGVAKPKGRKDD